MTNVGAGGLGWHELKSESGSKPQRKRKENKYTRVGMGHGRPWIVVQQTRSWVACMSYELSLLKCAVKCS